MSEHQHPGPHPDADSLNAFIEGVLPAHERLQCLAHLAECSRCREAAFLAQEPRPAPAAPDAAPAWRGWFAPWPVLGGAAAACMLLVAVSMYLHRTPAAPGRDLPASAQRAQPVPVPPPPEIRAEAQVSPPIRPKARADAQPRVKRESAPAASNPAAEEGPVALPAPGPSPAPPAEVARLSPPLPLPPPPQAATAPGVVVKKEDGGPADRLSAIAGTVTDPSGRAIPGATVTLRQLGNASTTSARTDLSGGFHLAGLPAGRYELQVTAPGFRQTSRQIDLQPQELAKVTSELSIGSVAETVEVAAASPAIKTAAAPSIPGTRTAPPAESRPAAATVRPLPSKLPAVSTAVKGKLMLAADSAGALFMSRNAGKSWKAVKPLWRGKVVRLVALAEPAAAASFQLTADSGAAWLSRDGSHWYPAPPQR